VWVIQQNYALHMLRNNVVDNILHEHLTYFTVTTLNRLLGWQGLEIFDVAYSGVKGGCIRTAVAHCGDYPVRPSVAMAQDQETLAFADDPATWRNWGLDVHRELRKTRRELERIADRGERCFVYGASSRGGTFLQIIGTHPRITQCAVDRQPAKAGKIMASTGLPIITEEQMRADPPEHLLIAPWFFRDGFVEREAQYLKNGGRMIFPLPHFEVVGG
jgi:NDP-4-keto-2,6-dideoxyhexose 3-C-methyltransferase